MSGRAGSANLLRHDNLPGDAAAWLRHLLAGGVSALASPRAIHAQSGSRRVGILAPGPLTPIERLKDRLREVGWVVGKNIRFEERWGGDDDLRYPKLAAELTAAPVDLIVTWSTPAVLAAKRATTRIPIVMGGDRLAGPALAAQRLDPIDGGLWRRLTQPPRP